MRQKSNNSNSSNSNKPLAAEEVLQAVVVADSFNKRFSPLTLDTPRCLLPLVNMPMIEYTLEFLAASGVEEIFIVCCSHSEAIREYIQGSRWTTQSPTVTIIVSQELRSMGDVLRDLDGKQLLQSDFVFVSGDVVSNVDLTAALKEHKERRMKDKNAIMTMLLKKASASHPSRTRGEEELFILDAKTSECVHYEPFEPFPPKRKVKIDAEVFKTHSELLVHNDLMDCHIDICSIEVPALFTENFDYQDMRRDFVRGILESDLLGKTIFCHLLTDSYAARVSTQQMYHAVSKDIMKRWVYPQVPENRLYDSQTYSLAKHYIYKEKLVFLARFAQLKEFVTIGSNTSIGERSVIKRAVIGRSCDIKDNVTVEDSYLFDNVHIGDDCQVSRCIIGSNVILKHNVILGKGSIIGPGVIIGPNVTVPPRSKISIHFQRDYSSDDDENQSIASDTERPCFEPALVGAEGEGYLFEHDDEDEDLDSRNVKLGFLDYDSECDNEIQPDLEFESGLETEPDGNLSSDENDWQDEVHLTLERAFTDNHTIDIAALELNTLKMAMNISFGNLREIAIPAILDRIDLGHVASAKQVIFRWGPLIDKFTHSEEDQIDALHILATHLSQDAVRSKAFLFALRSFYEIDVIEEEAIIKWYNSDEAQSVSVHGMVKWFF